MFTARLDEALPFRHQSSSPGAHFTPPAVGAASTGNTKPAIMRRTEENRNCEWDMEWDLDQVEELATLPSQLVQIDGLTIALRETRRETPLSAALRDLEKQLVFALS